jgi:hypothetical protein
LAGLHKCGKEACLIWPGCILYSDYLSAFPDEAWFVTIFLAQEGQLMAAGGMPKGKGKSPIYILDIGYHH